MNDRTNAQIAADHYQEARDSFDRCDTDGFVSQWAHNSLGDMHRRRAEIDANGGMAEFNGLYCGRERIAAKVIATQYGPTWLLRKDAAGRFGRKFVPVGERSRVQKRLGLCERREMAPASAKLAGSGTGLGGSVWTETYRTGCEWGMDSEALTA